MPSEPDDVDKLANLLVKAFKFSCETRTTKLMNAALDSLQVTSSSDFPTLKKMIEFGYIRGAAIDDENPGKKLTHKVVQTISSCFDFPDDSVQLQIIKVRFELYLSNKRLF